jgi:nitroreductase
MLLEKPAQTQHPVHDLIRKRWSPRAFAEQPVEPDKLLTLLEAASWAASSYNQQPWSFIMATKDDPTEYDRLLSCLAESNQQWAKHAPVLMISVAKLRFDDGKPNRHALHDVGAAVESLTIQAIALDLFVHQMAGFDVEKARSLFQIPQDYEPVAAIAIGYRGDPQTLPAPLRDRELAPRQRKPLKELVFTGRWGNHSLSTPNQ